MIENKQIDKFNFQINYYIDDVVVGFIKYEVTFEVINIVNVFVYENYRNKGVGSKLLSYLIKNVEAEKFMLEVNEHNIYAIKLYKNFGFKTIHVRKKYYKDGDALIMELKNDVYILAIESSCDETSVSIVKNGIVDVATTVNSQIDVHKKYGGVVPEVASRMHLENITFVLDETLSKANMKLEDMDAFACTYAPGLLGSLLVGLETTKTLSLIYNKPFIKVNHMMGHIYANNIGGNMTYPLLALIVSGGHTDLIYMKDEKNIEYVGQTLDDAVGECFDKVARIVDLPYPGGPNVEKLALNGKDTYKMPELLNDGSANFSFSGIKSHCVNLVHNEKQRGNEINKENLCCSFQNAVTKSLIDKTMIALKKTGAKRLILAGGVASNSFIRESLRTMCKNNDVEFSVPDKKYCTDNATMIGAAAFVLYKQNKFSGLDTNAKSHELLSL